MHSETDTVQGPGVLTSLPLLRGLPEEVQRLVERSFVSVDLAFGETVFKQGDPPDAYYVVASGNARVLVEDAAGQEVSLNMLRPGDGFGEASLLEGTPRTASVRASSDLTLLRLDRGLFGGLLESYPEIGEAFSAAARARKLGDFLRLHSAFSVLPRDATLSLIDALDEISLEDGQVAVRQGAPADAMFLIQEGRLSVWLEDGTGPPRRLRTLHAGEFFGERALVERGIRTATVKAEGPVLLRRLADEHFQRLLRDVPDFARRVRERITLYEARDRGIVSARGESTQPPVLAPDVWSPEAPGLAVTEYGAEEDEEQPARRKRARRHFPFARQIDEMDCGAACLAIVARAFGHDVSITTIRQAAGTSTDGTSLSGVLRGGDEIGLRMRAIKSSPDRVDALPLPAIIHWKGNHWVVLYDVSGDQLRISDPARGRRRVPRAELTEHWSGYAALAQPTERLAQAPRGGLELGWMLPMLRPHRRRLVLAVVLALFAAMFEMALPVFTQIVIDNVIANNSHTLLYELTAAMLGLLVLAVAATVVQRLLLARVAVTLDTDTLDHITTKVLRLPMRYFESRRTADIQRRLTTLSQVRQVLIEQGVVSLTAAAQVLVAFALMIYYSPLLSALWLLCGPLYFGLMSYSTKRLRPALDALEEGQGRYQSRQIDAIRGIEAVKAMGAEEGLRARMAAEFALLRDKIFHGNVVTMIYEGMVSLVTFLVYGLFVFVGALEVLSHNLTLGELVGFTGLVLLANGPVATLLDTWDRVQWMTVLFGRLQDVLEQEPEQGADRSRLRSVPPLDGHIQLRAVGFTYPRSPDRPILEGISLDVPPGATVGLVGRSGSGKSTLVKCLAGLLVPTSGTIMYDGLDLRELRFDELRRRIGFVLQNAYLFDDTIAGNIAFGDTSPQLERVRWAAETADAADFIAQLPLGYETRVGDSGLRLSGGQAQRVAIARALYHQPPVLIFDEATSALDSEAERAVKENLDRLLEGRTAFVIAHRLSTIRDADIICVLERGRVVEMGSHEELLERQGLYAYLLAQQLDA